MINSISLIGLGYLGKLHLKSLIESGQWNLTGIYDLDKNLTKDLAAQYGLKAFSEYEEALDASQAINIATPGSTHFKLSKQAVIAGKHVFIEKPVTTDIKEARQLQNLIREAGIVFQPGYSERYNPAFIASLPYMKNPLFIEVHRMAQYNSSGTDVSVVKSLMMHDLDLILSLVKSNVRKIHVSGSELVSATADIVNARIEFENGCVANITTNRMAFKNSRKFRVFTKENLVSINLLDKITEVVKIKNAKTNSKNLIIDPGNGLPKKEVIFEHPIILPTNAINQQLSTFHKSVNSNEGEKISIEDAIRTLELAFDIEEKLIL